MEPFYCCVRLRGFAAGIPLGPPGGVAEPADGFDHGGDCAGEPGEVDGAEFVGGLVVVLVQAEAGDGVGDDAFACEGDVVGPLEEILAGWGSVTRGAPCLASSEPRFDRL